MVNMWVIRAGKDTKNFNLYKKENFVSVGEDIGDIKGLSLDEIKFRLNGKAKNVDFSNKALSSQNRIKDKMNTINMPETKPL